MRRPSSTELELERLAAAGVDAEALIAGLEQPPVPDTPVPTIMAYDDDGVSKPFELAMLADVPNLLDPFLRVLAQRATELAYVSLVNERWRLSRFVAFVSERDRDCRLEDIDDGLLNDFRDWLDDHVSREPPPDRRKRLAVFHVEGGTKLQADTKILIMETLLAILRRLRAGRRFSKRIRRDLDLIRGGDWTAPGRRTPTAVLTRPQLKLLVRICREEVAEITARLNAAWRIMDFTNGPELAELVDPELVREVIRLDQLFEHNPPVRAKFGVTKGLDRAGFPRLYGCGTAQYNAAITLLYPSGRLLMPFALLFAIYYRYNPSVVAKLEFGDFSRQASLNGERLVGAPYKARSGRTQVASWPITDDPHNPAQMRETLRRWTSIVRKNAPLEQANHMFLSRYSGGKVRSFANHDAFLRALVSFLDDHEEALGRRFHLKSLRPTVINLVHHLFDGDLLVTLEAGQHVRARTLVDHYLSDGARQLNDELLVPVFHQRDAWVRTSGRSDPRRSARTSSVDAATPGWECEDRYFSPVARKPSDLLCTEYGMCAACPMGRARVDSPTAYAFAVKLVDAIKRSRTTMPEHAWLGRWSPILDFLERKTLRSFAPEAVAAADLDIPPLPTVE